MTSQLVSFADKEINISLISSLVEVSALLNNEI